MSFAAVTGRAIRWGVMGTGTIAHDFVKVLQALPNCEVAAVGSRSDEGAARFGDAHNISGRHGSYEALAKDESLDIVYVATPSMRHVDDSLLCLNEGRHVLCEKAMAPSLQEAKKVVDRAIEKDRFFLHGVWSRFFPAMAEIRKTLQSGVIGDVYAAHASFGQNDGAGQASATLETGIYCAQFLQWAFDGDARSRRPAVLRRLHAIDAHRLQERMSWLVSFSSLGPFGPSRETTMLRAGAGESRGRVLFFG